MVNTVNWSMRGICALLVMTIMVVFVPASLAAGIDRYDLNLFEYRQVTEKGRGSLVFQDSPRGSSIKGFKYHDGDWIYVNVKWRQDGYAMAYKNGTYGYVDASYIDWSWPESTPFYSSTSQYPDERSSNWQLNYIGDCYVVNCNEWVSLREHADTSSHRLVKVPLGARVTCCYDTAFDFYLCEYRGEMGFIQKRYLSMVRPKPTKKLKPKQVDRYDLSLYEYKQVTSKGRGSLVFQKAPCGSFMKDYKYYDGDWIYVNVKWRSEGYAMAYEDGTYGYVDASYIDW